MSNKVDYVGPQLCLEAFENMVSGENVSFLKSAVVIVLDGHPEF